MVIYIATFSSENTYIIKARSREEAYGIARGYFLGKEGFYPDFVSVEPLEKYLDDFEVLDVLSRTFVESFLEDLNYDK